MKVRIDIDRLEYLDFESLKPFQGNLKDLSFENYAKLKKQIAENGFSFSVHVWQHEENIYLIDGHQRCRTLLEMKKEGFDIPKIPCVFIKASSYKQAKEKLLAAASQYGTVTDQGLYEYLCESDIGWRQGVSDYTFDSIKFSSFVSDYFSEDIGEIGLSDSIKSELEAPIDNDNSKYSKKIEVPIYEITGTKPDVIDLFNLEKTNDLIKQIQEKSLNKDLEMFLINAAYRHTVFNYEKIAEFYAHSDKDVQDLMEKSALVIIDFNKAIENGFVQMSEEIREMFINDHG